MQNIVIVDRRSSSFSLVHWCFIVSLSLVITAGFLMSQSTSRLNLSVEPMGLSERPNGARIMTVGLPEWIAKQAQGSGWTLDEGRVKFSALENTSAPRLTWTGSPSMYDSIELVAGPEGGRIRVIANKRATELDLYDPFGKKFNIKLINFADKDDLWAAAAFLKGGLVFLAACVVLWLATCYVRRLNGSVTDSASEQSPLPRPSGVYLTRLDHLRFAAAAIVLLYHFFHDYVAVSYQSSFPLAALVNEGHTGVSLFMVLSGFIFSYLGFGKDIDYRKFMAARVVRIYPLYVFAIILAVSTRRWEFKPIDMFLLAFPVINFYSLASLPFFGQLWTIGVEFQFYAIFPFINKFVKQYGCQYLVGVLLLFLLIRAFYFNIYGDARDFGYWTILGRMDQFLVGILAAIQFRQKREKFSNPLWFPLALSLALAAITWFHVRGGYPGTAGSAIWIAWPLLEGAAWALVTLTYLAWRPRLPNALDHLLARLGAMSFSVYVMQYIALPQVQRYIGIFPFGDSWIWNVALSGLFFGMPAVLILSMATYAFIERPFFNYKFKYTR